MRSCERFVKQMLPILQDLRSQYNAEFPDITDDCVQVITLQRSSDGDLGLDLVAGDDGLVAVRSLAPGVSFTCMLLMMISPTCLLRRPVADPSSHSPLLTPLHTLRC